MFALVFMSMCDDVSDVWTGRCMSPELIPVVINELLNDWALGGIEQLKLVRANVGTAGGDSGTLGHDHDADGENYYGFVLLLLIYVGSNY